MTLNDKATEERGGHYTLSEKLLNDILEVLQKIEENTRKV